MCGPPFQVVRTTMRGGRLSLERQLAPCSPMLSAPDDSREDAGRAGPSPPPSYRAPCSAQAPQGSTLPRPGPHPSSRTEGPSRHLHRGLVSGFALIHVDASLSETGSSGLKWQMSFVHQDLPGSHEPESGHVFWAVPTWPLSSPSSPHCPELLLLKKTSPGCV